MIAFAGARIPIVDVTDEAGKPLRTLVISPFFDPALPDGGVQYSVDLTRAWLGRGRRVGVVCAAIPDELGDLTEDVAKGRLSFHPVASAGQLCFTHHPDEGVAGAMRRVLEEFRPEIIHVHNVHGHLSAIEEAICYPAPVMLTALDFGGICFNFHLDDGSNTPCTGPDSPEKCAACVARTLHGTAGRWGPRLPRSITRRLWPDFARLELIQAAGELQVRWREAITRIDAIITPSSIMAETCRRHGVPDSRLHEIVHGIAPDRMLRPAKEPSEDMRFGFLGSAERVKGLHVLLRAAELLPDGAPLMIHAFGNDEVRRAIGGASPAARRYMCYHRPRLGRALAAEHARIDAMLVPSLWHENAPFVVLESLANGTPVLASDHRGIAPLIDEGRTGWLIEPGRAEAWSEAILRAVMRPALIRWMQMHASYGRTTAHYVDQLEQVEARWLPELSDSAARPMQPSSLMIRHSFHGEC